MPPPETFHRHQPAVLWVATGKDRFGQYVVGDPVEILVRWEHGPIEMQDDGGLPVKVDAMIVTDQYIPIGSNMWLGSLDELPDGTVTGTGFMGLEDELMYVALYKRASDIKNRHIRREVGLRYYKDVVPS